MDFETILSTLKELNVWSVSARVILSVLLGGLIGLERGHHGRAAGLRTHILVCLGAAMATMIGIYSVSELGLAGDPLRVGAQVVSGIGFLGAGTIMVRNKDQITGLTTAAGLWATACIGLAVGLGFYLASILAFLAVIVSVSILVHLERSVKRRSAYGFYVELSDVSQVNPLYEDIKPLIYRMDVVPAKSGISDHVGIEIKADSAEHYEQIVTKARENQSVIISIPL